MGNRLSFWAALGTVVVCGLVTGVVMRTAGFAVLSRMLTAPGDPLRRIEQDAWTLLLGYLLLAIVVEAAFVKFAIGWLTSFTITFPRALGAGLLAGVVGLAPFAIMLSRALHPTAAAPGIQPALWMLSGPLSLAVLALHALLVAGLAEPRRSDDIWTAYSRTIGRE
jgi:hypothetical protein